MSRILVVAATVTLLGVTACNKPAAETPPPPAPEASVAPKAAEPAAPPVEDKPALAEKPVEAAPAMTAKPAAPAAKSGPLTREEALALASKNNCLACHKIDSKLVGPAWKDVAAKYKGDPNAAATIAKHIKAGGSFGGKLSVMPPRGGSQISDADVDRMAKFIASLK
jgi:cytochrome c